MTIAARILKDPPKDDVEVLAITTPEAGVDAKDDGVVRVETEPEAVVGFEVVEIQIGPGVGDFAGVVEEGAVEAAPDLVAVFALREDRVWSAEAVLAKAAKRVVAAERRHQIEGHDFARACIRRGDEESRRDHTAAGEKSEELPEVGVQPVDAEAARGPIVEPREIDAIPSAAARVLRLPVVDVE